MHAFREFVQHEMDARGWTQADLARASGLTRQGVSKMLNDTRAVLPERPEEKTVDGLARAFRIDRSLILMHVGLAMGLPVLEPAVQYDATGLSDDDLLRELARRLTIASPHDATPTNPPVVRATPSPVPRGARTGASRQHPRSPGPGSRG